MQEARRSPRRRVAFSVSICLVALLTLVGCATMQGGAKGTFSRAVEQTSSALSTAQLAYRLYADDRSTYAVTDTALKDSSKEMSDAEQQVEDASPQNDDEVATQSESLRLIGQAEDVVIAVQQVIDGVSSEDPSEALSAQDAALKDLRQRLEAYK
ncbi:MAG: Uncharacterized protein JWQ19_2620 [Subtercola sp.]|nr:Uncharacterized protein [Subtercola sp.]